MHTHIKNGISVGALLVSTFLSTATYANSAPDAEQSDVPASTSPTSSSQDSENQIGDIVVTAQRRDESAQRVAISLTALDADAAKSLQSTSDIGRLAPNIQVEQTAGFSFNRTGIRGIAQGDFNGASTTSNMVYIDDLPMNAMIAQGVPLWDIGRVEVLRGPQGTLFGRNATGGAIRYITQTPSNETDGYAEITFGNSNQRQFRAAANLGLSDTLRIRLSGISNSRDGDVRNTFRNRDENAEDYFGGRLVAVWDLTEKVRATLKAQYFDSKMGAIIYKTTPGLESGPGFEPDANGFSSVAQIQQFYGFTNPGPDTKYKQIQTDGDNVEHMKHLPLSLNLDFNLGFATLTSVTGYLNVDVFSKQDVDSSSAPILNVVDEYKLKQVTQELRLTSSDDGPFNWIVGAFYMYERNKNRISIDATAWRGNVSGLWPNANSVFYQRGATQKLDTYAGFIHTSYSFSPQFSITAAARYTHEKKNMLYNFRGQYEFPTAVGRTSYEYNDFLTALATGNYGNVLRAAPASFEGSKAFNEITWKFSLNYQMTPKTLLYALVSKGFKGGSFKPTANGLAEVTNPDGTILVVRPEIVIDYEAGVKSTFWNNRARVNASVFYYDYQDYQTNQFIGTTATQLLSNLPKAELYGIEVEAELRPLPGLTLSGGVGVTHSKLTESLDPTLIGNKLPYSENFNFNASIEYAIDTGIGKFTPQISAKHYGSYYTVKENDRKLGNYTIYNAQIDFDSSDKKFYGALWIKNIGNKVVPIGVDDTSETFGTDQGYVNQRRRFGITAGARF